MQMGFNNDVEYRGLTVHIQTEDIGLNAKKIISQVFFSGAILETKQISYADAIAPITDPGARDELIQKHMKALHRQCYKRLMEGAYDAKLPLARSEGAASPAVEADAFMPATADAMVGTGGAEAASLEPQLPPGFVAVEPGGSLFDGAPNASAPASSAAAPAASLASTTPPTDPVPQKAASPAASSVTSSSGSLPTPRAVPRPSSAPPATNRSGTIPPPAARGQNLGTEVVYSRTARAWRGIEDEGDVELGRQILAVFGG